MPRLYVLSGPDMGRTHDFEQDQVLGRSTKADLPLRSPSISRQHARIEHGAEGWSVVDMGSRNGIKVDGRRVERALLTDGLEFHLGDLLLRFRAGAADEKPAGRAPALDLTQEASDSDDGFELEGEWTETMNVPAAPAAQPAPAAKKAPVAKAPARPSAAERAGVTAGAAGARKTSAGGKVLQYTAHADRQGVFASDLGQHSGWVRAAAYLLALLLFLALGYGAYKLTTTLRAEVAPVSEE